MNKYLKFIIFFFFLNTLNCSSSHAIKKTSETEITDQSAITQKSFAERLKKIHMDSFGWEDTDWSANTMREYLEQYSFHRINPVASLKRRSSLDFLKNTETVYDNKSYALDNEQTWKDLNLFCGASERSQYVGTSIDRTATELGTCTLFNMLTKATTNISKLQKRQEVIQTLTQEAALREQLQTLLAALEKPETVLLSFSKQDHFKQTVNRHAYFTIPGFPDIQLDMLNESDLALLLLSLSQHSVRISSTVMSGLTTISLTIYGILQLAKVEETPTHITSFTDQYRNQQNLMWRYLWDKPHAQLRGILALMGATLSFWNTKQSFDWAHDCFFFEECIHTFTDYVATYLKTARNVYEILKQHPALATFKEFAALNEFFEIKINASDKLQDLFDLLESETFADRPSLLNSMFSDKGVFVHAYRLIGNLSEDLQDMMRAMGKIDAHLSLAQLMTESQNTATPYCFATYATTDKPMIDAQDFWHPLINADDVIPNSITLGTNGNRTNVILTGPNAGGKSSTLKALSIAVVMAQSVGIVPARSFTLTPFSMISTYLNITDDIGAGNSLFKTEAIRTQQLVDGIEHLQPGKFSFTVFDEIFHGTSPAEGTAAAYSVAEHLAGFDQSMCLIATHFQLLTELEEHTKSFSNYHVSVEHLRNGEIWYPYKLERGISEQHVALDILRNQGIKGSVIDKAMEILKRDAKK
ncbi:hypothetical protein IPF37_04880 [bacterium]|nr:MAG: hypothetical protein IPF37_04880 [bacterium]